MRKFTLVYVGFARYSDRVFSVNDVLDKASFVKNKQTRGGTTKQMLSSSEYFRRCEFFLCIKSLKKECATVIQIKNLSKVYVGKEDVQALKNIDIDILETDICGIIGMSGAGKSTLLRCIALLDKPTSGSIMIDGSDISSLKGKELIEHRKQIGVIFQGYHLLMQRTVAQNIAFPLELNNVPKQEINRKVSELLSLVGLCEKAAAYPSQLSGGQKQRVAIARALANNPKVLLCDEPTSALDSLTTKSILKLLEDINHNLGVTIIIITHEIGAVRSICNKVAVINNGSFVEQGDTEQIFTHPNSSITRLLLGMKEGEPTPC